MTTSLSRPVAPVARLRNSASAAESSLAPAMHSNVACPICAAAGTTTITARDHRQLIRCQSCSVVFIDPLPTEADLAARFADHYITDDARLEGTFGKSRDTVLSQIAAEVRRRSPAGRILDVGCAGGHFLSTFFASDSWQRFGIEPSRFASARAAEKNIRILAGTVFADNLPADYFDVITAIDVLYYFRQPARELEAFRSMLKPSGLLFIELALAETQLWRHTTKAGRIGGTARSLLDSGHLYFLNPSSISHLLRESGFKITAIVPLPGIQQRRACQSFLFRSYYLASRLIWRISGGRWMFGPSFLVVASRA
jgi:2-polyprenyl-3-methyl-5-hydroxy-6-metoxy-1,4-benzoquinol methylase